jgi:hypothetical protein
MVLDTSVDWYFRRLPWKATMPTQQEDLLLCVSIRFSSRVVHVICANGTVAPVFSAQRACHFRTQQHSVYRYQVDGRRTRYEDCVGQVVAVVGWGAGRGREDGGCLRGS